MPNLLNKILQFKICKAEINYSKLNPRNWKRPSFKKMIKGLAFLIIFLGAFIIVKDEVSYQFDLGYYSDDYADEEYLDEEFGDCNVAGISIVGDIVTMASDEESSYTSADDVMHYLMLKKEDKDSKALIIEIDSYGGYPVAAEEIAAAIKRLDKPTVAIIREYGNSAAYWVASAADIIFASKNSVLGSIGISSSYLDYSDQNQREGIKFIELAGGKFKNTGDPDKPLSQEEKDLIMRDVNILHQNFIEVVAENRKMDISKVRELADGSTMLGQMALENGLIDRIGIYYDAIDYLEELLGEKVDVCWY
jgi:protease IV